MNNRKRNLYILSVMVIILIAALMTACKTEDITKRAEMHRSLLRKSLQKPNRRLLRKRKPGRKLLEDVLLMACSILSIKNGSELDILA